MGNRTAWKMIFFGILGGLAPLIISLIASVFGNQMGMVLHWYTLVSFPVGLVVSLLGVIILIRNSAREAGTAVAGDSVTGVVATRGSNSKVKLVKFVYTFGAALMIATTAIRLFVLNQFAGILIVFEAAPIGFGIWLASRAWQLAKDDGASFSSFYRMQKLISFLGIFGGIYPAVFAFDVLNPNRDFPMTTEEIIINGTYAISSLIPAFASVLSLLFMLWVKKFQKNEA